MRVNGPIKVYNPADTVPTDAAGGYAGGDSTAAAIGLAVGQAGAAQAAANEVATVVGDAGGVTTTTATDKNLNSAAMPAGWRAMSAASTFSTGTDAGKGFARSTAVAAGTTSADYHGVMTVARPPIAPGAATSGYLVVQARASTATSARIYIQWLQGATSLGLQGNTTTLPISTTWTTLAIPVTFPAGVDNYRPTLIAIGPYAAGDQFDARVAGIITSDRGYFDGDTTDTFTTSVDREHAWDGTPGESTSTRTITTRTPTGGLGGRTVIQAINEVEAAVAGLDPSAPTGAAIPAPSGFTLRRAPLPDIRHEGSGYTTDVASTIAALRPPTGVTYYVSPTGGGTGTTSASPTTLLIARDKPDVGTIVFAPGEYNRVQAGISGRTTKSINYIAGGPGVRLTGWSQTLAWTLASGNVYATARTGAVSVGDPRVQYATDGVLAMYAKQTGTTAAAVTAAGQWATDGTTVWAWALGDTDLAANPTTLRVGLGVDVAVMHSAGTAYVEGIAVEGAGAGRGMNMIGGTLLMVDCTLQGAEQNGLTALDALVVSVRCDASANGMDGFNYHEGSGQCDFIEVNCTARRNGWQKTATNNGSTAHETTRGVRVGGRYADSHGPLIADVNSAQTWTVGAVTERNDAAMLPPSVQQGHYHADGTGGAATMWVQDADIDGLGMAYRVSNGATLAVRDPRRVAAASAAQIDATSALTRW